MEHLSELSDLSTANEAVHTLVESGVALKQALELVAEKTERTTASLKAYYYRQSKSDIKPHGHCALTREEEEILCSICTVYSAMHEGLSMDGVIYQVSKLFNKKVGKNGTVGSRNGGQIAWKSGKRKFFQRNASITIN